MEVLGEHLPSMGKALALVSSSAKEANRNKTRVNCQGKNFTITGGKNIDATQTKNIHLDLALGPGDSRGLVFS